MIDGNFLKGYAAGKKQGGGSGGSDITLTTLNVDENGTKTAPSGTAYNRVNVSVPMPTLDTLTATDNGTYTPQSGHAYDEVTVNVPKGITPTGTKQITENGTFDVTQFASAEVNVQGGGGGGVTTTLIGETPVMSTANNSPISDLCTVDIDGLDFNALLFLSKDKTAFKLLPYFTDTTTSAANGMVYFVVSPTDTYKAPYVGSSFGVAGRDSASVKTLTISHVRMTGVSGHFYDQKPQAFDIYAVKLDPALW